MSMDPSHAPPCPQFEQALTAAFQNLRRGLTLIHSVVKVDPAEPQEMARRLRVNRNLTWKVSRALCTTDLYQAMQHLPGDEGLEIFVRAAVKAGAPESLANEVDRARGAFEEVIEAHVGGRSNLELFLDSMGGEGSGERLEQCRRLAFRGNSGVLGVQARARLAVILVAPAATNAAHLDLGHIHGMLGF